jgi:hypothetical protein
VTARLDDGLQERALERQHLVPCVVVPSGNDRDDVAVGKDVRHVAGHAVRVAPTLALDEHRARAADHARNHGPARDLGLGHEAHGQVRVQHEDVEPRDVIGDEQHVAAHRCELAAHVRA